MEQIGSKAFQGCSRLSEIELPEYLGKLGTGAFSDCVSLKKVEIPSGLTSIPKSAFNNDRKLSDLKFSSDSHLVSIGPSAFS